MNGGAVSEERSPLKDAIDYQAHQQILRCDGGHDIDSEYTFKNDDQEPLFWGATAAASSLEDDDMRRLWIKRSDQQTNKMQKQEQKQSNSKRLGAE